MADEQRRLVRLRQRVTELCVLRAWTRKRLHMRHVRDVEDALAWHQAIAERTAKDYPLAAEGANELGGAR